MCEANRAPVLRSQLVALRAPQRWAGEQATVLGHLLHSRKRSGTTASPARSPHKPWSFPFICLCLQAPYLPRNLTLTSGDNPPSSPPNQKPSTLPWPLQCCPSASAWLPHTLGPGFLTSPLPPSRLPSAPASPGTCWSPASSGPPGSYPASAGAHVCCPCAR